MARPTKYDPDVHQRIVDRLRAGCTRRAACVAGGISTTTFATWLRDNLDFLEACEVAEAECEVQNTAMVEKAAFGYNNTRTSRTVKTVMKMRKLRFRDGGEVETRNPDGTITRTYYPPGSYVEEPVALEEVSEQTTVGFEFSPAMALEWLKRQRRFDWGENVQIDPKKLSSEQILELLLRTLPPDSFPAGPVPVSAAGSAGEAGG